VINSNLDPISDCFWDTATYTLKHSIESCSQTSADGDVVTIDSLWEVISALFDGNIADFYNVTFCQNTASLAYNSVLWP